MAILQHGGVLPDSAQKTDFYNLIDEGSVSSITDADISNGAQIQDIKLSTIVTAGKVNVSALVGNIANTLLNQLVQAGLVSGASLVNLINIPAGAGIIPLANIGGLLQTPVAKNIGTTYQALTDGVVTAFVTANSAGAAGYVQGFTDPSTSPVTLGGQASAQNPATGQADHTAKYGSFQMFVQKNNYYVVNTGVFGGASSPSVSMTFMPMGS